MNLPVFKLTRAAKDEIQKLSSLVYEFPPAVSVQWSEGGSFTSPAGQTGLLPAGWGIGFYDLRKIPEEFVREIEGIHFVLEGRRVGELDGKVLDFNGKRLFVIDVPV